MYICVCVGNILYDKYIHTYEYVALSVSRVELLQKYGIIQQDRSWRSACNLFVIIFSKGRRTLPHVENNLKLQAPCMLKYVSVALL